jgi:hypothetical protein
MFLKKKKSKNRISEDVAADQVDMLLDYYDLTEDDIAEAEKNSGMSDILRKLKSFVRKGRLSIELVADEPKVTMHLKKPQGDIESFPIAIVGGRSKVAMKDKAATDYYGRIYAMMGVLTGFGEDAMREMKGPDLSCLETLGMVFLSL